MRFAQPYRKNRTRKCSGQEPNTTTTQKKGPQPSKTEGQSEYSQALGSSSNAVKTGHTGLKFNPPSQVNSGHTGLKLKTKHGTRLDAPPSNSRRAHAKCKQQHNKCTECNN